MKLNFINYSSNFEEKLVFLIENENFEGKKTLICSEKKIILPFKFSLQKCRNFSFSKTFNVFYFIFKTNFDFLILKDFILNDFEVEMLNLMKIEKVFFLNKIKV